MTLPSAPALRLNREPVRERLSPLPQGDAIPRILHQTYRSPPWPEAFARNADTLVNINPDWEYRFYDDDAQRRFIGTHYDTDVLAAYDSINARYGAARADLFRYLLLYREGGVYLDMKSTTTRPLDDVLRPDDRYLLSTWRTDDRDDFTGWGRHAELGHLPHGEFQQWFIAAAPGHPFLKAVIEMVLENIRRYVQGLHGSGAYAVLRVTGPVPYTLAIEPLLPSQPHRIVDSARDLGLVYSIFDNDLARSHEKMFPHYSNLELPLVRMGRVRAMASAGVIAAKRVARAIRRR